MRTLIVIAAGVGAVILGRVLALDSGSKLLLGTSAYLLALALARPRWLMLTGPVQDAESSREGAAITAGLAAVVLSGLLVWRLIAIHHAERSCRSAIESAAPGHDRIAAIE